MFVSPPCRTGAALSTYICPSRNSSLNSKSCPKMAAGEIFNFLHIVHPRQMSLVSAPQRAVTFMWENGNLRSFCWPLPCVHFATLRSSASWSIKGMKRFLGSCIWGDQWPCRHGNCVIRASLVTDSMRWGSVSGVA